MRQVIIYPGEDGYYVAEVPSLPGCISQGATVEEAVANIKEAIEGYIATLYRFPFECTVCVILFTAEAQETQSGRREFLLSLRCLSALSDSAVNQILFVMPYTNMESDLKEDNLSVPEEKFRALLMAV